MQIPGVRVSPGSTETAEMLVVRGGKTNHCLSAYSFSKISAKIIKISRCTSEI